MAVSSPNVALPLEGGGAVQQSVLDSLPDRNRIAAGQKTAREGGVAVSRFDERIAAQWYWFLSKGSPAENPRPR
jgi:hypothetical protein